MLLCQPSNAKLHTLDHQRDFQDTVDYSCTDGSQPWFYGNFNVLIQFHLNYVNQKAKHGKMPKEDGKLAFNGVDYPLFGSLSL